MEPALLEAKEYAIKKHGDQMYGDRPYAYHLQAVFEVALRHKHNLDRAVLVAAWLHDILEDTNISYTELRCFFGPRVADLVRLVTDEPGKNRKERAKKTLPKIRTDHDAVALKLCDRIANVKACLDEIGDVKLLKAYREEYVFFNQTLWRIEETNLRPLWYELDKLIGQIKREHTAQGKIEDLKKRVAELEGR